MDKSCNTSTFELHVQGFIPPQCLRHVPATAANASDSHAGRAYMNPADDINALWVIMVCLSNASPSAIGFEYVVHLLQSSNPCTHSV